MNRSVYALLAVSALLAACSTPKPSPRVGPGFANGKAEHPLVKMGDPYTVRGETYVPKYEPEYSEEGMASWYGPGFHGGKTANGERFDATAYTAAHRTLPMPSLVRVTNLANGKSVVVRVNDRGPFAERRIIDLSKAAAQKIDMIRTGVARVRVEYMKEETQSFIEQMKMGRAPEEIALDQSGGSYEVASNAWVSPPSREIEMATNDAATFDSVSSADLPPPVASSSAPAAAPTPAVPPAPSTGAEGSYMRSAFEATAAEPSPAPAPVAKAPEPVAPPAAGMYVQVGAFSSRANAERAAAQVSALGEVHVLEASDAASPLFRVRVGPFADQYSADNALLKVREQVPLAQLVRQ